MVEIGLITTLTGKTSSIVEVALHDLTYCSFPDRDMVMRYSGGGIGHAGQLRAENYRTLDAEAGGPLTAEVQLTPNAQDLPFVDPTEEELRNRPTSSGMEIDYGEDEAPVVDSDSDEDMLDEEQGEAGADEEDSLSDVDLEDSDEEVEPESEEDYRY